MESKSNALITGANGPLGQKLAGLFAQNNFNLILTDIQNNLNSHLSSVSTIEYLQCDLSNKDNLLDLTEKVRTKFKTLNVLINNAGLTGDSGLEGYMTDLPYQSAEAFMKVVRVNLLAPFLLIQKLSEIMNDKNFASIVNVTSIYGVVAPQLNLYKNQSTRSVPAAYAATKGGLNQLTKYFATMLSPNIRVNAVAPGGIKRNQTDDFVKKYSELTPMARMANDIEICEAIMWLSSKKSQYITGQILVVDGGWSAW